MVRAGLTGAASEAALHDRISSWLDLVSSDRNYRKKNVIVKLKYEKLILKLDLCALSN